MNWAAEEFKTLNLDDARLNARAVLLAERLSNKPTESIPGACHGGPKHKRVIACCPTFKSWQALRGATLGKQHRTRRHPVVLTHIQDTTWFNSTMAGRLPAQPLSYDAQRGSPSAPSTSSPCPRTSGRARRLDMGAANSNADGVRDDAGEPHTLIEGYERVAEWPAHRRKLGKVHVADREADILAFTHQSL